MSNGPLQQCRVAIDGPVASGKSAVGSAVAERLGCPFVDTGAMYRAFTWLALREGIAPEDADGLARLAANVAIQAGPPTGSPNAIDRAAGIRINGLDATPHLREPAVEQHVSRVSAVPAVRARLVALQRQLAGSCVVMAGRDIGSVVLPDAEVKVYLDATVEERARRRFQERVAKGEQADYETVLAELRRRDESDQTRATSPLRPADDAVRLMTDGLSLGQVIDAVLRLSEPCREDQGGV